MRPSKRLPGEMRTVSFERNVARHAEGSCFVKFGDTHVLCTASLEDKPPMWLRGQGRGWVTAEYSMLPRSGRQRNQRDLMKPNGRNMEIQRLIGRALRSVVDMDKMGERTITVDCDAIQADGGTRTAAITGAWVAMSLALNYLRDEGVLKADPITDQVAAVSCGVCDGVPVLDLDYEEDSEAEADSKSAFA